MAHRIYDSHLCMPSSHRFTCGIVRNDVMEGCLHLYVRHYSDFELEVPGLVAQRLMLPEAMRNTMVRIAAAYNINCAKADVADFKREFHANKTARLVLHSIQTMVQQYLETVVATIPVCDEQPCRSDAAPVQVEELQPPVASIGRDPTGEGQSGFRRQSKGSFVYRNPVMPPKGLTIDEPAGDSPKNSKKSINEQPKKKKPSNDSKKTDAKMEPPQWPSTPSQKPPKSPRVYLKPKAIAFKPLYTVDSGSKGSAANTSNMKLTLASLRALFGAETLPYLDQFAFQSHHTCCALVVSGILSVFKIVLIAFAIAWTALFNSKTLNHLQKAYKDVFDETEDPHDKKLPTMMAATLHAISSSVYCLYFFGAVSIAGEVALIVSTALRQSRPMAISLVSTFISHFWVITILYAISITAIDSKEIAGSFIGNLILRDFTNHEGGRVYHNLQEDFECCGFEYGPEDWHKNIALNWTEPGLEEPRSFFNDFKWSSTCPVEISCLTPLSCCKKEFVPNDEAAAPQDNCNRADISRLSYDKLRSNREELLEELTAKYPEQINDRPCVPLIAKRIDKWAYVILGVVLGILVFWGLSVWLITLTFAEVSGMGSIDPHTRMVDPTTLRGIVPFGALIDSKCCCGAADNWPMYDEGSERDAVRDDRTILMAIEEGKPLNTLDVNANASSIGLFLPNLAETQSLTTVKSKKAVKKEKDPNKVAVKPKENKKK